MLSTPAATAAPLDPQSGDTPRLPETEPRDFFLYTFSRKDLAIDSDGYLIAVPCKLLARPGLNGVQFYPRSSRVNHDGAILQHQKAGRIVLPDDFPVRAFGEQMPSKDRAGRPLCTYRVKHEPSEGAPQYHDAWNRWRLDSDGEWACDVDAEGYALFLRQVASWLAPEPHQVEKIVAQENNAGRAIKRADLKVWSEKE